MFMPPFAKRWECKMNKFMNQLIHDFMYDNVVKYSWHILNIVKKEEDKLYVRVASFYRLIHNLYALAVFYQEKKCEYF